MTVKELIAKLEKENPDALVLVHDGEEEAPLDATFGRTQVVQKPDYSMSYMVRSEPDCQVLPALLFVAS